MIGIFDSGVGGLISFREVRRLLPRADVAYLADRKNAPYGTKTKDELKALVSANIEKLRLLGCKAILSACCTASATLRYLPSDRTDGVFSLLPPTARLAAGYGRVTVIATEATVRERAFSEAIAEEDRGNGASVTEMPAQELVGLVEAIHRGGKENARLLDRLVGKIAETEPDALILGCTHFSHLEGSIGARLSGVDLLSPAVIGAKAFVEEISDHSGLTDGQGKSIYTEG